VVSVVINNHNYADYLAVAIDSALAQTWPDTEVVVVDDGSTDESRDIIRSYGTRVVSVFQDNGGQAAAFNTGVATCRGDIVLHLDSDDRLHPDAAELAVGLLADRPDAGFAQFRLCVTDEHLKSQGTLVPPAHVALPSGDVSAAVARWELPSALGPGGAIAHPRGIVDRVYPLPEPELRRGADTYLVRAAALLGPVVSHDVPIADYRSHGRNDSNQRFLDVDYLHEALRRQVAVGALLQAFAARNGLQVPIDPLEARDAIMLSQRLASLRARPGEHPFPQDTRLRLARAGIGAALRRSDIGPVPRAVHALWFVVVAVSGRRLAVRVATLLLFPLSRPRPMRLRHRAAKLAHRRHSQRRAEP
jgi:hypothetical protein